MISGYVVIGVGVNPETAKKAVQAGADLLVAGAYIFGSPDPKMSIEELYVVSS